MSVSEILNLSRPRLVIAVVVGSVAVVGFSLHSLRYHPKIFDSCEGIALVAPEGEFERAVEVYLRDTRNWSVGDYCIDDNVSAGSERRISISRRGMLVGGGEGFRLRIDQVSKVVRGELPHQ